ncbi:helix-turn-helix domain-containing protein [Methylobacterium planeticum]|uniref:Helix-turn-helix domain-containing protein n=1 Tax=Methylobacterium planeticum TaxID=2615211 RepID=A0A6N6MFN8_9HYPH|nr:helix-turn-helix domain-containing protein [Methylobacterium planeticum]KAB1068604.1 helix-turn-helix domain-containing protein [Methylobacterium planeticum]
MDTGRYQGGDVAARLKTARRAAGFLSAGAAAAQHGWGVSLYQQQESGNRAFTASDVERFAEAFHVVPRWIVTGQGSENERLAEIIQQASQERSTRSRAAAGRLRFSRLLRGFRTVGSAAETIGLKRTTLTSHELGSVDLSTEWASVYGAAFGVRPLWLTAGTLPSGLGEKVDSYLKGAQPSTPDEAKDHAAALRNVSITPVAANRVAIAQALKKLEATSRRGVPLSKRRPTGTVMIPEVQPTLLRTPPTSEGAGESVEEARPKPVRTWGLPSDYLASVLKADARDLRVVASAASPTARSAGERYVISTAPASLNEPGSFVLSLPSGSLLVARLEAGDRSLGETLAGEGREEAGTLLGRLVVRISQVD